MKSFHFFILSLIPLLVISEESCNRPAKLIEFEEACKTDPEVTGSTGSFLEQLQENIEAAMEQTKRLVNIAKKKLGIRVNEDAPTEQMKKCEYYQCIFKKMESLGINNYPNMTLVEAWVNDNVDEKMKDTTLTKTYSCFNAMATSIAMLNSSATDEISAGMFSDDKMVKPSDTDDKTDRGSSPTMEDNAQILSSCDLSANLMMCLHNDMMCSTFQYP